MGMMKRPTGMELRIAAAWLDKNDTGDAESKACLRTAKWLREKADHHTAKMISAELRGMKAARDPNTMY